MNAFKSIVASFVLLLSTSAVALGSPSDWVSDKSTQIIGAINEANVSVDDKAGQRALAESIIIPHVDIEGVAARAVGRPWRQLSETDRARFVEGMKGNLIDLYGGAFVQFKEAELEVLNERIGNRGDRAIVNSRLRQPAQGWMAVEFRLVAIDNAWHVRDVAIEGLSLLNSFSADFEAKVERLGLAGAVEEIAAGS